MSRYVTSAMADINFELENGFPTRSPKTGPSHFQRWEDFEADARRNFPSLLDDANVKVLYKEYLEEFTATVQDAYWRLYVVAIDEDYVELDVALRELRKAHGERCRAYSAKKQGHTLYKLWERLPKHLAEVTEGRLLREFNNMRGDGYPSGCWAPQPWMAAWLWKLCGYQEKRFRKRFYKIVGLVKGSNAYIKSYSNADGECHHGDAFEGVLWHLKRAGRINEDGFDRLVRGLKVVSSIFDNRSKVWGELSVTPLANTKDDWRMRTGANTRSVMEWGRLSWRYAFARAAVMEGFKPPNHILFEDMDNLRESYKVSLQKASYDTKAIEAVYRLMRPIEDRDGLCRGAHEVMAFKDAGFGRAPQNSTVRRTLASEPKLLKALKPCWKYFQRVFKAHGGPETTEHQLLGIERCAVWFRDRAVDFAGKTTVAILEDLTGLPQDESSRQWLVRLANINPDKTRDYCRVCANAAELAKHGIQVGAPGFRVADAIAMIDSWVYDGVLSVDFAMEAKRWKMNQKSFTKWQARWLARCGEGSYECIPFVRVSRDRYVMRKLSKDDPRGPFLGEYTNCCQHPGGVGSSCARHGMMKSDGCFYVVEKDGNIIAQSWTWRQDDVVVFDNIEALYDPGCLLDMYRETAQLMLGRLGVAEVHVGVGYNDANGVRDLPKARKVKTPSNCYTDADEDQRFLAG